MNLSQLEVLQQALAALDSGRQVTLVTVAGTWGSSPRPPGAMLAVCDNGVFFGSVSGGCVEDDLLARLAANPPPMAGVASYGGGGEESARYGLPCGGILKLVLEPLHADGDHWREVVTALNRRENLCRALELSTGKSQLRKVLSEDSTKLEGDRFTLVLGPVWRLLIIGAGEPSRYLADIAESLGYQVLVCDPRPNYARGWDADLGTWIEGMPDDVVAGISPDRRTAIVALTHDPRLDDMALLEALHSPAFYVGALGSIKNNRNRRQRLREHFGFDDEQLGRLRGPVGLPIGSKTPAEIAVAIAADLIAISRGIDLGNHF